jgi:SAM-dependent methyltransferase
MGRRSVRRPKEMAVETVRALGEDTGQNIRSGSAVSMPGREVPKAFDEISKVYDETRDPLDEATLDRVSQILRDQRIERLLEIGVGTGRVALPLVQRGLEVTGIDASRGMLARARGKRLDRLVRGSAYALPFADGAFDAGLFVHVLHLLDDPAAALRESCRVGRAGAYAIVRPPRGDRPERFEGSPSDPRRIVYDLLASEGYPIPARDGGPRARESRLLRSLPPDRLEVVTDREVTEPLSRRIDMLERRGSRHVLHIPAEVLQRATTEARRRIGDRTITYRRTEALATWTRTSVPTSRA